MKPISVLLQEYLEMRRALGAQMNYAEWLLRDFLVFLERRHCLVITTQLALEWAILPQHAHASYRARRLAEVRHFAGYAHALDMRHETVPQGLLPSARHRCQPHIYSDLEICAIIKAARQLSGRLRPLTYSTLLGLLSVTGMRSGEVVNLDCGDVDLQRGRMTIRNAKFGKSRMIFCHETTRQQLISYARQREARFSAPHSCAFFLSERGQRIHSSTLRKTFRDLSRTTGLRGPRDSYGPRLHDLRHTFAVNTLRQWHLDEIDVERWLPRLSTWLGHAGITETYWYLSAVPQLMAAAAQSIQSAQTRMDR